MNLTITNVFFFLTKRRNVMKSHPVSMPSGISLCHPQNTAYCTDGSRKFFVASFRIVSIPSRRTSALSNCRRAGQAVRCRAHGAVLRGASSASYLFQQTLPHLLHIHRFFFKGEVGNRAEQCGLRVKLLDILLQPLVPVNTCNCAQQGLPFILRKPIFMGLPYSY